MRPFWADISMCPHFLGVLLLDVPDTPQLAAGHFQRIIVNAFAKKSLSPKLPDFSASSRGLSPSV